MRKKMTEQQLADKWIKDMQDFGLTPDQMLECIKMARERYRAETISDTVCEYKESHDAYKKFHELNYCPICGEKL